MNSSTRRDVPVESGRVGQCELVVHYTAGFSSLSAYLYYNKADRPLTGDTLNTP